MHHQKLPTRVFLRVTGGCTVTSNRNSAEPAAESMLLESQAIYGSQRKVMAPVPSQATRRPPQTCWQMEACFPCSWSGWDETEHAHGGASSSYSRATCFIMSNDENILFSTLLGGFPFWQGLHRCQSKPSARNVSKLAGEQSPQDPTSCCILNPRSHCSHSLFLGTLQGCNLPTCECDTEGRFYKSSDSDMNLLNLLRKYL